MKRTTAIAAIVIALVVGLLGGTQIGSSTAAPTPAASATPPPVFPGSRNLEKALRDASAGQLSSAADFATEGARELDEAAPLRILSLEVVQPGVQGFGLWTEVPAAALSISKKDPLVLYFEPSGFARKNVNGVWTSDLIADISLYAPHVSPQPFLQQKNFVGAKLDSRRPNREIYYAATLHVTGVPAGDYVAEVTLRDNVGGETAKAVVPFKLVP